MIIPKLLLWLKKKRNFLFYRYILSKWKIKENCESMHCQIFFLFIWNMILSMPNSFSSFNLSSTKAKVTLTEWYLLCSSFAQALTDIPLKTEEEDNHHLIFKVSKDNYRCWAYIFCYLKNYMTYIQYSYAKMVVSKESQCI